MKVRRVEPIIRGLLSWPALQKFVELGEPHSFHLEGSRIVRKVDVAGWTFWLEESASAHLRGSRYYGVEVNRAPGWRSGRVNLGRFSVNLAKSG